MDITYSNVLGKLVYSFYIKSDYVGKCIFELTDKHCVFIRYLFIEPEYRKQGLGKQFYQLLETKWKNENIHEINLIAEEQNEKYNKLQIFYESLGFTMIGKPRYVYNNDHLMRMISMTKNIKD
jgi:GNAT superfamily N-acetyltransferase